LLVPQADPFPDEIRHGDALGRGGFPHAVKLIRVQPEQEIPLAHDHEDITH
jgi:hypothetical protein